MRTRNSAVSIIVMLCVLVIAHLQQFGCLEKQTSILHTTATLFQAVYNLLETFSG
jgi:hypothetical protein